MMRPSVIAITLGMLALCGGLAYLHATRERTVEEAAGLRESTPPANAAVESLPPPTPAPSPVVASTDVVAQAAATPDETKPPPTATAATPDAIAQWIKDTDSTNAQARAAAIAALADAPKAQAIPALKRVLEVGEPNVDRHIALRSLHSLALRDGDSNGQIRDVMRHAVYHGDDDGVTQTAQSLLDDIEAELTEREQSQQ